MVVAPLTALQEQGLERGSGNVPADLCHHHPVPNLSQMRRTATERSDSTANRRSPFQTGYYVGLSYDENVRLVRQTAHDINHNRTSDGGIMLMLDNAKAFDRLQHTFMVEVLQAFNLPPD